MARFLASILAGLILDGLIIAILDTLWGGTAVLAAITGTIAGLVLAIALNEFPGGADRDFDRRRLRPTIVIAFIFALIIHMTMLLHLEGLRPLVSFALCAIAALAFAAIGHWRFFNRR